MLGHVFGIIGLILIVSAWQFGDRSKVLWFNIAAFIMFSIELYLLDAPVGAIMMLFAAVSTICAIYTQNKLVMTALMIVPVSMALFEVRQWYDLLPIIAHITGSIAFFSKKMKTMRSLAPIGTFLWAVFNTFVGAWGQLVADIFILSSMAIGMLRHRQQN